VASPAGPELGVEVRGPAEAERLLQEADIMGEEDETFSISGKDVG
jgi:hypothetical protein